MLVLLALVILLLFASIIGLGWVAYHLLTRLNQVSEAYVKFATQQSDLALDAARQLSQRTPQELKSVLASVDKSVTSQLTAMMEAVRTAWSPTPDVHVPVSDVGQYKNPYPTPWYADEASNSDLSDPTDAYLRPQPSQRGAAMVDLPLDGEEGNLHGNPFGIDAPLPEGILKAGL